MKTIQRLIQGLVAGGLALAVVSSASAQTVQVTAKVVRIGGKHNARISTDNRNWQPLKLGALVGAGATIQTDKDSYVDLVLGHGDAPVAGGGGGGRASYQAAPEQNTIRIKQDSALAFDKMTSTQTGADVVTETQLDLQRGKILGNVKKMSAASRYEIKIPNGVAGIRGTSYEITVEGVIRVLEGSLVVAYPGPDGTIQTQVVVGGQQFDIRTGAITPIPAVDLHGLDLEIKSTFVEAVTTTVSFVPDHTILFISPTQGAPR